MKLLVMRKIVEDGKPVVLDDDNEPITEYFILFETMTEEMFYSHAQDWEKCSSSGVPKEYYEGYRNGMISGLISQGTEYLLSDDDIYYYASRGELVGKVGERFRLDDDGWEVEEVKNG